VFLQPIAPDLNENHAVFSSLILGARFCALEKKDLLHITGPRMVQDRASFTIPGSLARNPSGIMAPGIILHHSWPGWRRLVTYCPVTGEKDAGAGAAGAGAASAPPGREATSVEPIPAAVKSDEESLEREEPEEKKDISCLVYKDGTHKKTAITKKEIDISGINVSSPSLYWDCCVAVWARSGQDSGRVRFYFPVVAVGPSHDHQKVASKVLW